jgi:hypothetical protein
MNYKDNLLTDTDVDYAHTKLTKFEKNSSYAIKLIFGVCIPLWLFGLGLMLIETLSKYYHNQSLMYLVRQQGLLSEAAGDVKLAFTSMIESLSLKKNPYLVGGNFLLDSLTIR